MDPSDLLRRRTPSGRPGKNGRGFGKAERPTSELAFPTGRGGIEHYPNLVNRGFRPAQVAAGVVTAGTGAGPEAKYPGLHNLRHFYAFWCINRRADGGLELPAKVVQERLGHSSITMTLDTYGHLFPRGDDGAELDAAERALLG